MSKESIISSESNGQIKEIIKLQKQARERKKTKKFGQQQFFCCCPMTLNDFEENQETLFYDAGIFKRHECIATKSRLNKNYLRVC